MLYLYEYDDNTLQRGIKKLIAIFTYNIFENSVTSYSYMCVYIFGDRLWRRRVCTYCTCTYIYIYTHTSLKMLMRHYLPKVVEKLRSTLVHRLEAGINQQTLSHPRCFSYTSETRLLTHPYRIRGSRYRARVRNIRVLVVVVVVAFKACDEKTDCSHFTQTINHRRSIRSRVKT